MHSTPLLVFPVHVYVSGLEKVMEHRFELALVLNLTIAARDMMLLPVTSYPLQLAIIVGLSTKASSNL